MFISSLRPYVAILGDTDTILYEQRLPAELKS